MAQVVRNDLETETEPKSNNFQAVWLPALMVSMGWIISTIISFLVANWMVASDFEQQTSPQTATVLFMALIGLTGGFSLSVGLYLAQEQFIGVHSLAYTIIVTCLTASFAYISDSLYVFPVLFVGLCIGMKWAKPQVEFWYMLATFVFWMVVAASASLIIMWLGYNTDTAILRLFWQVVWSGIVGLLGSAFTFWQLQMPSRQEISDRARPRISAADWERIYSAW